MPRRPGITERWRATRSPARPDPHRVVRRCAQCPDVVFVFGDSEADVAERLDAHAERRHPRAAQ